MSGFLKRVFLFIIVFFIFDKLFYIFILLSPALEKDKRLERVINGELHKEIIILGSSRGARNIIAGQVEDSLRLSTYNLSYPGSDIEFLEYLLRSLIKFNTKPKIALLAIDDPEELLPSESIKFRLDRLYPLAKYTHINDELIARDEKSFLSRIFILARINKRNFDIRVKHFSALDTIINCGSMPIWSQRENFTFAYDDSIQPYPIQNELKKKLNAFLKLQELCGQNDIKLVLAFSPNYKIYNYSFEERLRKLMDKNTDIFIYDTSNPVYKDSSYFFDASHLRTSGAVIFTNEIIDFLKNYK